VIIKHILNLDDRETVAKITENIYPAKWDKLYNTFLDTFPISKSRLLMTPCLLISGSVFERDSSRKKDEGPDVDYLYS